MMKHIRCSACRRLAIGEKIQVIAGSLMIDAICNR